MFKSELMIHKALYNLGLISKHGGGEEMSEWDEELEEEGKKQSADFDERIERIKNGIEHNEGNEKEDSGSSKPVEEAEVPQWKQVSEKYKPAGFNPPASKTDYNYKTKIMILIYILFYNCGLKKINKTEKKFRIIKIQ